MTDMNERNNDAMRKEIVKEAINEWLDAKFAQFGKWSLMSIGAAGIAVIGYYFFTTHGVR
jgi:hypothetical protein